MEDVVLGEGRRGRGGDEAENGECGGHVAKVGGDDFGRESDREGGVGPEAVGGVLRVGYGVGFERGAAQEGGYGGCDGSTELGGGECRLPQGEDVFAARVGVALNDSRQCRGERVGEGGAREVAYLRQWHGAACQGGQEQVGSESLVGGECVGAREERDHSAERVGCDGWAPEGVAQPGLDGGECCRGRYDSGFRSSRVEGRDGVEEECDGGGCEALHVHLYSPTTQECLVDAGGRMCVQAATEVSDGFCVVAGGGWRHVFDGRPEKGGQCVDVNRFCHSGFSH